MNINARRGFQPEDIRQFTGNALEQLQKAAKEVHYLFDHGYPAKTTTVFVGNHYSFSERQRLALVRSVSPTEYVEKRLAKEIHLSDHLTPPDKVYIDGFNTIITLEVALSHSPILACMDGTYRDLAGLRGTYRLIDETRTAVGLILTELDHHHIKEAVFYLDQPVSNSGRLKQLIMEMAEEHEVEVTVIVIPDVDRELQKLPCVITSDAIILNHCESWINLVKGIIDRMEKVWKVELVDIPHTK
ncbi:MAG: DUF434 domain-containing protein [Dorea sp.]|nr:DUF434 domain-containing protein [Dorea sp.]